MCRFCLIEGQCLTVYELYHVAFSVNITITSALCINKKCLQPHHIECTSSRLITEVKQYWAELVLRWVTAWEYSVLQAKTIFPSNESILLLFCTWFNLSTLGSSHAGTALFLQNINFLLPVFFAHQELMAHFGNKNYEKFYSITESM